MKKGCRLCEQEVLLDDLRDHSFKCKDLYDLKDKMDTLNMQLLSRIHEAVQLKTRVALSFNMSCKPDLTNYHIATMEDLSKSNRALEKVLAYGNKIQHENFIDYDNGHERELIDELTRLRKEIQTEDVSAFLFFFGNLIEEKKTLKARMAKLELELKKTLAAAGNTNPDAIKQAFFGQKSKTFKHQKKSPKLFSNMELKQESDGKDAQNQNGNMSLAARFLERGVRRKLPTIDEIDSATGTPSMHRRTHGPLKQIPLLKGAVTKSASESPHAQGVVNDLNMNFSSILKSRMTGGAPSSFAKQKSLPTPQTSEPDGGISSYLNQNLIPTKPSPVLGGKDSGLNVLHQSKGPLKATEIHRSPKKDEELSPQRRPNLLNLLPEVNSIPAAERGRDPKKKEPKMNGKTKRPNSVTLFNKLEGQEKYQMNRFPSLSREVSPTKFDEEKPAKKSPVKKPTAEDFSPKPKSPKKKPLAPIRYIAFGEDELIEDKKSPEESPNNYQKVYYEPEILKAYNSDTNTRNELKKHSVIDNACITDFHFIKMISKGGFGKVWLVKHNKTQDLYAMKIIDSEEKMNENRILSLEAEKNVFKLLQGDYVVKAVFTFTHENYICFVMEYVIGGDFGSLLERVGFFDEEVGRFYIGEIILAIESMHKINIVHRDLKPDNILIDSRGHIKLADFGLSKIGLDNRRHITTPVMKSKKLNSNIEQLAKKKMEKFNQLCDPSGSVDRVQFIFKNPTKESGSMNDSPPQRLKVVGKSGSRGNTLENTKTPPLRKSKNSSKNSSGSAHRSWRMVGTPDYMAPEVIEGESTGSAIDWWAVGVILYEFLVGIPPFNGDTIEETFDNISNMRIEWPKTQDGEEYLSPNARDLLEKLLTKDPNQRLGTKSVDDIKNHEFFKGFDWEHIRDNPAPIKPIIVSETDISHFEKDSKKLDEEEKQSPFKPRTFEQKSEWTSKLDLKEFQMKRRDLLHQLNLEDYEKYKNQGKESKKEEGEKRRKLVRGYTTNL